MTHNFRYTHQSGCSVLKQNRGTSATTPVCDCGFESFGLYIDRLTKEVAEANEKVLRVVRGEFGQICSYCGHEFAAGGWDELQRHIKECEEHPVFNLSKENEQLKEDYDTACDDAMTAAREGRERAEKAEAEVKRLRKDVYKVMCKMIETHHGTFANMLDDALNK